MNVKVFRKIARGTLVFVYLVVLAGGIVRMSGSGMGCPDWPRCFGEWIPPTRESQLPENYRELYAGQNSEKVDKFSKYLAAFGMAKTAQLIKDEASRDREERFNAAKTWTEYINRLCGFLAGNLMLLQAILALIWFRRERRGTLILCLVNLLLLVFQAWFGSIVVATNLVPWVITIHFIFALLIIYLQLAIVSRVTERNKEFVVHPGIRILIGTVIVVTVYQIFAGTQVRQMVDTLGNPKMVFETPGFMFHRSFAWVVLALNGVMIYFLNRYGIMRRMVFALTGILLAELLTGIVLYKMDIPQWSQPIHLVLACILFGIQSWLFLRLFSYRKTPEVAALT